MTDSPGSIPVPFGTTVWHGIAVGGCVVQPFRDFGDPPWPNWLTQQPVFGPIAQPDQPFQAPSLSDEDIDRIARRVAELLKSA